MAVSGMDTKTANTQQYQKPEQNGGLIKLTPMPKTIELILSYYQLQGGK